MNNAEWMQKHSERAYQFHYGDGGDDLREYLVEYLSEAILSLRGSLPYMAKNSERKARIRIARMIELKRTFARPIQQARRIKRATAALVEFRAAQAQMSANTYGAWERDDVPFIDFEKMPGISNTSEKAMVESDA